MVNRWTGVGRLGKDVDLRYTNTGKAVASFTMAVDGGKDSTEWVTVNVWEKTAENCAKYLSKGSKVGVTGHWQKSSWEHEGKKYYRVDCVIDRVEFLSSGQGTSQGDPGPDDEPPPF